MLPIPPAGRDPAFATLREAPVPDRFDDQMARLRAAPRRANRFARAAVLAAGLVLVAAACAVPVSVQSPLGYAVRWAVAGSVGEGHASARAFEAAVPEADRLVAAVDPGADSTRFRYVVAGPEPDVAPLRADAGVHDVHIEAVTEPARVPLGVWAARQLGASRTVRIGTDRLPDAVVQRLLAAQLAETGIDTSDIAFTVSRNETGRRTVRISARATRAGARTELTLPVGAGTLVRVRDGVIVMGGFPRGVTADSLRALNTGPMPAPIVVRRGSDGRAVMAAVDSVFRARGLDPRGLDDIRRTLDAERSARPAEMPAPHTPSSSPRP